MSEDMKELMAALSRAQARVDNVKKTSLNPHFKSKYADLASVWDTIREPFTSEGLSISQMPCEAPAGSVGLGTVLMHSSGQQVGERFYQQLKDPTNPQATGSALTYMRRYALMGLAGIAPEDDDGNSVSGKPGGGTAGSGAGTDWAAAAASALKNLKAMTKAPDMRGLYSNVNNSAMPEPGKLALLTEMGDFIRAFEKGGK